MLWLLVVGVYGKFIEEHFSLEKPQFVGKFSGNEVTVIASCRIDVETSIDEPISLQLWVFSEKVDFRCGLEYSSKIDFIDLGVTDEWGEDLKFTYENKPGLYFYLSDCQRKMSSGDQVILQLDLQDTFYEHYPVEYAKAYVPLGAFLVVHLVIIFLAIYGIYQETHEEIPLVFIFVISLVYIVSIVFNLLAYWIYGMDGSSFKFILVFCRFFEAFGRVSLLGILLLITSENFDPKEFFISGSEFLVFFAAVSLEFITEIVAILRYEVMESIEAAQGIEALAIFLTRLSFVLLANKYKSQNISSRLFSFPKAPICIKLLVLLPLINFTIYTLAPNTGKFAFLYSTENLISVLAAFYLLIKFMSTNFAGVLPTKKHKT